MYYKTYKQRKLGALREYLTADESLWLERAIWFVVGGTFYYCVAWLKWWF